MNDYEIGVDLTPHVYEWQYPIVARYKHLLNSTGGNSALELLNDFQDPENTWFSQSNFPRFILAASVSAQVQLLNTLAKNGGLR